MSKIARTWRSDIASYWANELRIERGQGESAMRRRAGHTLLELMVVISIIFTMLAIFTPYYVKAVKMARHRADTVQGKHDGH